MTESSQSRVNVLMIGSGEYTTGYVHGKASESDKSKGGIERYRLCLYVFE
jgi:D-galacturonate reductase